MKILETFLIPQAPYLALRWVRGSGLQGRDNRLRGLRLDMQIDPGYGTRIVGKAGYCLVTGDTQNRSIIVTDPMQRVNPRIVDLATLSAASAEEGTGTGSGTGTTAATGSGTATPPAAIGAAAVLQDLPLYETQQTIRFGTAGGIRGRCAVASETYLPWVLLTAVYTHVDGEQAFVAQADDKGEFAIDLAGIRRLDDNGVMILKLGAKAVASLTAKKPPDPAAFTAYRMSPDGATNHLGATIDVTLPRYGETVKLGDVLIAPGN